MRPVFDSLESFFGLVAGRAEALGEARSWRMGRWLKHGVLTLHEAMLRVRTTLLPTAVDDAMLRTLRDAALPAAPRYPQPYQHLGRVLRFTQELRDGFLISSSGVKVPLSEISWTGDSFERLSTGSRFHFHALKWVNDLVEGYELTGDRGYLDRAAELAARWIDECLYTETRPQVWDDHGTALRALALCRLWTLSGAAASDNSFDKQIVNAIFRHAEKLSREGFYRHDHNHGVTQAYALLAVGFVFRTLPAGKRWARLGRQRLEHQMARNVSAEGLHLEHSPYYHFYVFRQFYYAFGMAQTYDFPFSAAYRDRLVGMVRAGADLIKPNGRLAALGDTCRTSPALFDRTDLDSWCFEDRTAARWLAEDAKNRPLRDASVLYRESGLAVFRHAGDAAEANAHVNLRLATYPTAHIHRDVFSFEFFAYGSDLIVDSGGPFAYGHALRDQYFLTTKAHNTVTVDDQDQDVGRSRIVRWRPSAETDFLVAEHQNYPGVTHRRAVLFIKPGLLVVIDKLLSDQEHRYSQLFHLAPELTTELRGEVVATENAKDGATVKLVPLLAEGLAPQVYRGLERPYQGWICTAGRKMESGAVVEYSRAGKEAVFAALIVAEQAGQAADIAASMRGRPFDEDITIDISLSGTRLKFFVSADGEVRPDQALARRSEV